MKGEFEHSVWTQTWPFLQVIYSICCLVYSLITCIHAPWLFSSHISTLWEWCLPLPKPWRKRVGMWVNKRGDSEWRWELKVNTRGWSVTVKPPLHMWSPLCFALAHLPLRLLTHCCVLCSKSIYQNQQEYICLYVSMCMWITHLHTDWVHVGY